jgi:hypothetical protein
MGRLLAAAVLISALTPASAMSLADIKQSYMACMQATKQAPIDPGDAEMCRSRYQTDVEDWLNKRVRQDQQSGSR